MIIIPDCFDLVLLAFEIECVVIEWRFFIVMPPGVACDAFQRVPGLVNPGVMQGGCSEQVREGNPRIFSPPQIVHKVVDLEIIESGNDLYVSFTDDVEDILVILLVFH